ncbi:MAG: hypothetical protein KIT58_04475 [Planctomycetota bacterium]|nr:hypothetical protein [Planctomycetota bacterium]
MIATEYQARAAAGSALAREALAGALRHAVALAMLVDRLEETADSREVVNKTIDLCEALGVRVDR